jgi:hypothetical protein
MIDVAGDALRGGFKVQLVRGNQIEPQQQGLMSIFSGEAFVCQ